MAISRISEKLMPMEDFKSEAPVCGATIESWIRKSPERLPDVIRIGIRRYFRRGEAEKWLRDNFASDWVDD